MSRSGAHLLETFRWSAEAQIETAEVLAAGLGMAIPVLLAALGGHLRAGLVAAVGSLAVGRVEIAAGIKAQVMHEAEAFGPVILAAALAILCGGHEWRTSIALVLLSGVAGTIGGFSRPMVVATTRFILFLMIVSAVPMTSAAPQPREAAGFLALVAAGALWTSALSVIFGAVVRRRRGRVPLAATSAAPVATARQKYVRWRRSLTTVAGWSYPIRLVVCLALAAALDIRWPGHHLHWVGLTVAILTPRRVEPMSVKTTQRAFGTAIGVVAAGIALPSDLPAWALAIVIALLAGARPLLRVRNYLAYSAVMTPLIVLIIDAGRAPESGLLLDRLVATLIGAGLVIGANLLMARLDRRGYFAQRV